uniref:Peptidase C1A papain C-terminal domain-containing protein n=1 Tax=Pyrodinium bahamense TaxID=73915 RepID=A0A7S0FXM9_9DINO|mmetsp:Transcript_51638/g.142971  ORF Transcript_51638/g.142971 Transcript_51638/m.142971 type:complete len:385 (+) Transcript_51638:64-1218(+)
MAPAGQAAAPMITSLVTLLLAVPGPVAASSSVLNFEAYLARFGLQYPESELPARRALFVQRLAAISEHNAKDRRLWTAGVNELTAATAPEISARFGYSKALREPHVAAGALAQRPLLRANLAPPRSFDWRDHRPSVATAVKNQGSCGCCWAFAAAAALESHIALKTGILFDLSPQQLNSCTPNPQQCGGSGGCLGATAQLAFNYTIQAGINTQWNYPYMSGITGKTEECLGSAGGYGAHKYGRRVAGIRSYVQLPRNDAQALMAALLEGPVAVTVAANEWFLYDGGIFDACDKIRPLLNHAVVLMGFGVDPLNGDPYWLVQNSWGTGWGEGGRIRLLRHTSNTAWCGVDDQPELGTGCDGGPEKVTVCGMCGILYDNVVPHFSA